MNNADITIIKILMHTLLEVGFVADCAERIVSRDSGYTGSVVPHSLAAIQQLAAAALQDVSNIMQADIAATEGNV